VPTPSTPMTASRSASAASSRCCYVFLPDEARESSVAFELKHHHSGRSARAHPQAANAISLSMSCSGGPLLHDIHVIQHGS